MKEIEKRVLLTDEQYKTLLVKFNVQYKQPERQITTYYNAKDKDLKDIDLRLMQTISYTKLWMKGGKIHDISREESEVRIDINYAQEINKILNRLYTTKTKWFRERIETQYKKAKVCIDRSINYGAIFEIEILTSVDEEVDEAINLLNIYLQELELVETTKEVLNEKYESYISKQHLLKFPEDEIQWLHYGDINK